jgi:hypothetical protein
VLFVEIVVVNDEGHIVGFLDEAEITQLYRTAAQAGSVPPPSR